jgi:hypothetical protein
LRVALVLAAVGKRAALDVRRFAEISPAAGTRFA